MKKKKSNTIISFDGLKAAPLSQLQSWEDLLGIGGKGDESVFVAYKNVPYLYAAIQSRMEAISATPWNLYPFGQKASSSTPVTEDYPDLVAILETLLPVTEGALCLYGCAYWLVETNRFGRNPTPRWAIPSSIIPRYDPSIGLVGFERIHSNGETYFPLDERRIAQGIVYFWIHSLTAEESYDIAPAQVALRAARASGALSEFADRFFSRGAVKQTLLMVPEDADPSEVENLRSWWQRLFRGVRSTNQTEVLRQNVQAVTIGEGVKDLSNEELDTMLRRHIGSSFRVPESILVSSASNYAISHQDWLNFWEICVKPEMKRLRRIINTQFLKPLGIYLWEEPERLEFYQEAEIQKSQSLVGLVQSGLISPTEARNMLEYGPLPADYERMHILSKKLSLLKQASEAGLSLPQASALVGLDIPDDEHRNKDQENMQSLIKAIEAQTETLQSLETNDLEALEQLSLQVKALSSHESNDLEALEQLFLQVKALSSHESHIESDNEKPEKNCELDDQPTQEEENFYP